MIGPHWSKAEETRTDNSKLAMPFGVTFLDDALTGIFPNDLILVGAPTGAGKTEFVTNVALQVAQRGKRVVLFALEADRYEVQQRLMYREMARLFFLNYAKGVPGYQWPRFVEWYAQGLPPELQSLQAEAIRNLQTTTHTLEVVYWEKGMTVEQLCEIVSEKAPDKYRHLESPDLFIIDHLQYFDFGSGENEMDGMRKAMRTIRDLCQKTNVAFVVVSHLRKRGVANKAVSPLPDLEDFHGHSDTVKVSTVALLLAPAHEFEREGKFPTYFHIAKSRKAGDLRRQVAVLSYDMERATYSNRYQLCEHWPHEAPKAIEFDDQVPLWAKHAKRPGKLRPAENLLTKYGAPKRRTEDT